MIVLLKASNGYHIKTRNGVTAVGHKYDVSDEALGTAFRRDAAAIESGDDWAAKSDRYETLSHEAFDDLYHNDCEVVSTYH